MKHIKINRFWQIAYPMFLYYVLYHLFHLVFQMLIGHMVSPLFCLMLSAITTWPFIYKVYRELPIVKAVTLFDKKTFPMELVYILGIVFLGVFLNVLVTQLHLVEGVTSYETANNQLYSGTLLIKILANAIFIPALEELLYRGIICGQLSLWYNRGIAIMGSAILFGIMHFNVVQFMYAFLVGIALSAVYIKTKKLWVVFCAHGLTNLVVVLYTMFA